MNDLHTQVAELLQQEPTLLPAAMAERLGASELEIVRALPNEMAVIVEGGLAQSILESLVDFGPVTTIVHAFGSIFEVKAPFPKGKAARGYYNLMGKSGELHGHLKLDNVAAIALVSKPFMGQRVTILASSPQVVRTFLRSILAETKSVSCFLNKFHVSIR